MRNNLKALALHFIIIIFSLIFLMAFVATGPLLSQYMDNIISRIFIGMLFLFVYIFSGTLLDIKKNKEHDYLAGCFIAVIGIAIWVYTFLITGRNLDQVPKELSEYWIPMNIYHTPFTMIKLLFSIPNTPLISLISNFIPTVFMGFGLKYKRIKSYSHG